jgi:UDP-2,3-diacylglucosamine pyrophosphatase LpxH
MTTKVDTLLVSDIHLGSMISRVADLQKLLGMIDFKRLILLGDVFHDVEVTKLKGSDWDFLAGIRSIIDAKGNDSVVWVRGNHDGKLADKISDLFNIPIYEEYKWKFNDKWYLAIHGDKFSQMKTRSDSITSQLHNLFYLSLQKLDSKNKHIIRLLDSFYARAFRVPSRVSGGAGKYAEEHNVDFVFCGHTHFATSKRICNKETNFCVEYFNVGCWTKSPSTYAIIDDAGAVSIESY